MKAMSKSTTPASARGKTSGAAACTSPSGVADDGTKSESRVGAGTVNAWCVTDAIVRMAAGPSMLGEVEDRAARKIFAGGLEERFVKRGSP